MSSADTDTVLPCADAPGRGFGRRRFLGYVLAAPTLTVAARLLGDSELAAAAPGVPDAFDLGDFLIVAGTPTAYDLSIEVTAENRVVVKLPRIETGQGLTTAIAMIVADELDAPVANVDVLLCDAEPERLIQLTGGSNSIRSLYDPMRTVAAAARSRLIAAASVRWGVDVSQLIADGMTVRAPDGRSASYAELTAEAATVVVAAPGTKKDPSQFQVIGTPTPRIDARDIVTGRAQYTQDLPLPDAVPTVVARAPTIGATVVSYDDSATRAMPGVVAVAQIPSGVAVSAGTFGDAMRAADALRITWSAGSMDAVSDAAIRTQLAAAALPFVVPPLLTKYLDATYEFPYISHAPLEVHSAVADVRADSAEVWLAAQSPIIALQTIAQALGLPESAVTLHVVRAGGSFGRRLFFEPGVEAALVSRAIGRPVKLMWTRNDDIRHGRFRPATHHKLRATWALGRILSFEHRMACAETDFRHGLGEALSATSAELNNGGFGQTVFNLTSKIPYDFGVVTQTLSEVKLPVPTGSWRSVYSGTFAAANEMMIDQVARAMGKDPVDLRRSTLSSARLRAVLDKVAAAGPWGRSLPPGHGQGVAVHEEYRSAAACLVEVDATGAEPRATRVVWAVDVGRCINPTGLEAQLQGATMDALSVMYRAGNHIDHGRVRESSYADLLWARMRNSPPVIEVHVLPPTGEPGGAGELGLPSASAAAVNALARATGVFHTRFPTNNPN